jgi:hypothetical protein
VFHAFSSLAKRTDAPAHQSSTPSSLVRTDPPYEDDVVGLKGREGALLGMAERFLCPVHQHYFKLWRAAITITTKIKTKMKKIGEKIFAQKLKKIFGGFFLEPFSRAKVKRGRIYFL